MIANRVLVAVGPMIEATDRGYWLLATKSKETAASKLVGWLLSQ
jgi:hypothetical protein